MNRACVEPVEAEVRGKGSRWGDINSESKLRGKATEIM